jgi:Cu(I)/Ag(I) efflux system membrane protein CusA/SilA
MADEHEDGPIDAQEVLRSLEDVRSRLRTTIWALHGMHQDLSSLTVDDLADLEHLLTETLVHLKPTSEWREGMTLDRLRREMSEAVQLPGVSNIWTMPIINRIDMLTTGIRSEVGPKVTGTDVHEVERVARDRRRCAARPAPRTSSGAGHERQHLNIEIDRAAAAWRWRGRDPGGHQHAVGETTLTMTIEGGSDSRSACGTARRSARS